MAELRVSIDEESVRRAERTIHRAARLIEERAIRVLLDGLGVRTIGELNRVVDVGRAAEGLSASEWGDRERELTHVVWLIPGDPQDSTVGFEWWGIEGLLGPLYRMERIGGPGGTWGPPTTVVRSVTLETAEQVFVPGVFVRAEQR